MHIIGSWQRTLAASAFCLALWLAVSYLPTNTTSPTLSPDFSWSRVVPQASLAYRRCFGDFQCARLSVPLDWNNASQQHDAAVAVIKLPATVPVTDPRYGGPVVLNPGGPGESGVRQVLADAKHIQSLLDAPGPAGKRFDIVSFDPRGVNNTTPPLSCFPDARNQQAWLSRSLDVGLLWDSDSVVGLEWARAAALGASCSAPRGQVDILPYLNTAQVVEDMVHIIESEGEWRAKEAQRLLGMGHPLRQPTSYHPGQEKIQFWGMSYGMVGSTASVLAQLLTPRISHRPSGLPSPPCIQTGCDVWSSMATWTLPTTTLAPLSIRCRTPTRPSRNMPNTVTTLDRPSAHCPKARRHKPSRPG